MVCADIMKQDVECITPDEPVERAARLMRDENVGFLPVCRDATVIGAVTDRDITLRVVAEGLPGTTPVERAMTRQVVACRPTDDVRRAEQLMGENQKSRIMCLDDQGRLVGVISLSDIAQRDAARVIRTLQQVTDREARM